MRATSERRLGFCKAVQFGDCDGQFCLGDFEFSLNLAALGAIESVAQLSSQFLNLYFEFVGHLRLLTFVKDDRRGQEGMAGSGIAPATDRAGEWGSRFAQAALRAGGASWGEPLILEAAMPAWYDRSF
uniref:Uncharacterized protein n=1 Tax=Sinorhizobium meliloti (strain SM11) TaxID=707241 RepID=A4KVN9_SINMM|nr:hypothetical protein [Sinorhizobium meliloti SM11]